MIINNVLEDFKNSLVIKNNSQRTIETYLNELKRFIKFIESNYSSIKELHQITGKVVNDYSSYLICYKDKKGKQYSNQTKKLKLIVLKVFFSFLLKNDYIIQNPAKNIELPRDEITLPKNILSQAEITEILNVPDTRTPIGLRNKAVIEILYSSAIRTSELADLKINDIDYKEQTVIIRKGKGGKMRIVPLTMYALEYTRLYIEKARKFMLKGNSKDEGYLFLTTRGKPFNRSTVNKCVIHQVMNHVNIQKHVTAYTFRHSTASHLVKSKVDIRFIQELLGHSNLQTTQKYTHLNMEDLKKMHQLHHPRDSFGKDDNKK